MSAIDWPLVGVITYGFVLTLIIVVIVLKGRETQKSRYSALLEEKETKLARMQLDIEETMESLELYANQLREDWNKLRNDDHEVIHKLHKRQIDYEAGLSALKAKVSALEVNYKSASKLEPKKEEEKKEPPIKINPPEPQLESEQAAAKLRLMARAMYDEGADLNEIAKALSMSIYEIELLVSR